MIWKEMMARLTPEAIKNFKERKLERQKVYFVLTDHKSSGGWPRNEKLACDTCGCDVFWHQEEGMQTWMGGGDIVLAQCPKCNAVYILDDNHWLAVHISDIEQ